MDLSAVIFVVLALAWAVYLIPKALSHHDEMASDRLVEGHSDKVRILSRKRSVSVTETVTESTGSGDPAPVAEDAPVVEVPVAAARPRPTRAAARRAARNRRRVLSVLVGALLLLAVLAVAGVAPWWTVAVPGVLVVAFLVLARLSARRMQQVHVRRDAPLGAPVDVPAASVPASLGEQHSVAAPQTTSEVEIALAQLGEDADGAQREQLEAALADDGSLWDPLPMTLPTYVNKARARRTVRTIELTGMQSSGHDEADTVLAREAAETAAATAVATEAEPRKVAGA